MCVSRCGVLYRRTCVCMPLFHVCVLYNWRVCGDALLMRVCSIPMRVPMRVFILMHMCYVCDMHVSCMYALLYSYMCVMQFYVYISHRGGLCFSYSVAVYVYAYVFSHTVWLCMCMRM